MAIQDKVLTLKGADARALKVEVMLQKDGSYQLGVYGDTKTSSGQVVGLEVGTDSLAAGSKVVADLFAHALTVLRKANQLE